MKRILLRPLSIFLALMLLMLATGVQAIGNTYYVSQTGSGSACSLVAPCSFSTGHTNLLPGDTLVIVGTLTSNIQISKSGTVEQPINIRGGAVAANQTVQDAVLVTGSYLDIGNLDVSGGNAFGLRIKGHDIKLHDFAVHDSVWENRIGDACRTDTTGGWGRGLTFAYTSYNIEVYEGSVYNNCGEGVGFTQNTNSFMHHMNIYDNFSRNVYIGNASYVTLENNEIWCSNPDFFRNGNPARGIGLAIETTNYSIVGNRMHHTWIRYNFIKDCLGINFYQEVAGQEPSDVWVENNIFVNVPAPIIVIPGTNINISGNESLSGTPTPTSQATNTSTPTDIPSPTDTPTDMPTPTDTPTSTPTNTPTPTPVCYPVHVGTQFIGYFCPQE